MVEKIRVDSKAIENGDVVSEVITESAPVVVSSASAKVGGKWIDKVDTKTCSECGYELHGWAVRREFKYCPECGAPMMAK